MTATGIASKIAIEMNKFEFVLPTHLSCSSAVQTDVAECSTRFSGTRSTKPIAHITYIATSLDLALTRAYRRHDTSERNFQAEKYARLTEFAAQGDVALKPSACEVRRAVSKCVPRLGARRKPVHSRSVEMEA